MAYTFNTIVERPEKLERMLVGRKPIVDLIHNKAIDLIKSKNLFQTLIIGPRGSGKTHLLRVFFNRIWEHPTRDNNIVIAYMVEDERGIDNFFDLMRRIAEAILRRYTGEDTNQLKQALETLKATAPNLWESSITQQLLDFLNGRELVIIIENLNIVFDGIGNEGQSKLRDFIQQHTNVSIVASSQALFKDIQKEDKPFQNFFSIIKLAPLSFEDALILIKALAQEDKLAEFENFLYSKRGQANVHAVYDLTYGNHRLLVTFYDFLKAEYKSDLSEAFLQTIDRLKPYYESYFKLLSAQQQKIVQYLCSERTAVTGKQITMNCFIAQNTISKQMSELQKLGYVESTKIGKNAYYEITEPMLRLSFDINESSRGIVSIFISFLTQLYEIEEIGKQYLKYKYLADFQDEKNRHLYIKEAGFYQGALTNSPDLSLANYEEVISGLDSKEAREQFLESLNITDEDGVKPSLRKQWISLIEGGKFEEAMLFVKEDLEQYEETFFHHFAKGYIYQEQNNDELAQEAYLKSIELKPDYEITWNNLGNLYTRKNQFQLAKEAYKKAIEITPDFNNAWYNLGVLYSENNQYQEAEEAYKKAIELKPDFEMSWNNLGNLYSDNNQFQLAREAYKKAIELKPDFEIAWNNLGNLYSDNNQFQLAREAYKKAIELKPDFEIAWNNLGNLYTRNNQFLRAEEAYKKAIELKSDDQYAWYNLGFLYSENNQYQEAEEAYKKAIELNSNNWKPWYSLTILLYDQNQTQNALACISEALEKIPNNNELLYLQCSLFITTGEQTKFIDSLTQYLASGKSQSDQALYNHQMLFNDLLRASTDTFIRLFMEEGYPLYIKHGYQHAFDQAITGSVSYLLQNHEDIELKRLKMIEGLFDEYLPSDSIHYWKVYINIGIEYFYNKDEKALFQLSKEERSIFLKLIGKEE